MEESVPVEKPTELLIFWVNERESIRRKKEDGLPKPWTEDPIMRFTRFTNVRREDDKVTKWIAKHWRDDHADHPNLTAAMVLARMVNRIETLDAIGFPWNWDSNHIKAILRGLPPPIWGNAYLITTCGKRMDKVDYVVDWVSGEVLKRKFDFHSDNLFTAHAKLMNVDGLGSFLSAQVVADLKNTPLHPLEEADDWWTWSAHGPGSLKGLSEYHGTLITPAAYDWAIRSCYKDVEKGIPRIHMQDFQNCLCEFSKYMRIRNGGRAKNGYPG